MADQEGGGNPSGLLGGGQLKYAKGTPCVILIEIMPTEQIQFLRKEHANQLVLLIVPKTRIGEYPE